ncbi:arabinan endo-1,5-alpha-L-arabinosidase [Lactobacillus xujianguonis]|uniref:Arabinan endo-1,5-alpha-L-arabinosidase n=1 Tax=Lactobacillus xujianguonis TaxID=2495899 RepID=A0A437SUZ8_9LACO|nr:glycoside hydrolase family 43 protein [Lactobacillus xujianguonis]RVU70763.1 arabinan endo-1,5-alpha-L-arabinosidase [Lactobacillus xujianguonis]
MHLSKKRKHQILIGGSVLAAALLTFGLSACSKQAQFKPSKWKTTEEDHPAIHDPSVVMVKGKNGKAHYYVFGTHVTEAESDDLVHWNVPFKSTYDNPKNNIILGNFAKNLKVPFKWAGHNDADSAGGYAIWAPDVHYDPDYEWSDGSKGAYLYYFANSSTWRRSVTSVAASKSIKGPYTNVKPIVYSGFTKNDATDGSDRNIKYTKTNLPKLIKEGKVSGWSNKWNNATGTEWNHLYAPNAIDPCVFNDAHGKMWMVYGSWSGGIFLLKINPKTGTAIYPKKDGKTKDGRIIDRYFGIKLLGGYHQSGEGPYIMYDKATKYYYLFVTYGGLDYQGGYNMRMWRSKSPEGPYVDAKGQDAPSYTENSDDKANTKYGIKISGNYKLPGMDTSYKSGGHNSFMKNNDGKYFLVYHTRFSYDNNYQLRVHEMMMNKDAWPVNLPFAYTAKKPSALAESKIPGKYTFYNLGTKTSAANVPRKEVTLTSNHKITGGMTGTWKLSKKNSTSYYLSIKSGKTNYEGVATTQYDKEEKPAGWKVVFSAIGNNNETIWCFKDLK